MADPVVIPGASAAASSFHPETQVVTATLHNSLMTEAQNLINAVVAEYATLKAKFGSAVVVAAVLGFIVGIVL